MKSSLFAAAIAAITLIQVPAARAATIDMNDPHRALGRENDVRVDAQLAQNTVSPGTPIGVTYQIQNLGNKPVAVADRVADATYDDETRTITVSIGSEVPQENMPHMVVIAPGEKKVLRTGATPSINVAAMRTGMSGSPRFVQVKVTMLTDITPFAKMISNPSATYRLPDDLFDKWFECTNTILLNALPVRYTPQRQMGDASDRDAAGGF